MAMRISRAAGVFKKPLQTGHVERQTSKVILPLSSLNVTPCSTLDPHKPHFLLIFTLFKLIENLPFT